MFVVRFVRLNFTLCDCEKEKEERLKGWILLKIGSLAAFHAFTGSDGRDFRMMRGDGFC